MVEHQPHNQPPPPTWIKQHGIHIPTYTLLGGTNQLGHTCVNNSSTHARKSTFIRNRQQKKAHINIKQTTCQHILSSNNIKCNSAIGPHKWPRSVWFVAVVVCVCTLFVLRPNEKQNTVVHAGGTPNTTNNHHPQLESNNMEYTSPLTYYSVVQTSWDTHV